MKSASGKPGAVHLFEREGSQMSSSFLA